MSNDSINGTGKLLTGKAALWLGGLVVPALAAILVLMGTGCATTAKTGGENNHVADTTNAPDSIIIKEGDTVTVTFPGAPNLNIAQHVRSDGMITLQGGKGEFHATGLSPQEMEKKMHEVYDQDLVNKEITVQVDSAMMLYVTGSVLRPGKIAVDHPVTVIEAIMEAGGPIPNTANLKGVQVVRQDQDHTKTFKLNIQQVYNGRAPVPFNLKQNDIIVVPEKFNWF